LPCGTCCSFLLRATTTATTIAAAPKKKKNLTTTCDIAGSKEGMVRRWKGAGKLYRNPLRALTYQQTSIVSNNNNNKRNNNHMMVRHITHTHCDRILGNSQTRVKVNFRLEIELAPASYFVFMINCTHYVVSVCVCVCDVCVCISYLKSQRKKKHNFICTLFYAPFHFLGVANKIYTF